MAPDSLEHLLARLDRPVPPSETFAAATLERLLAELERPAPDAQTPGRTETRREQEEAMTESFAARSRAAVSPPRPSAPRQAPWHGWRPRLAPLATAALVLLTLFGSLVAFGGALGVRLRGDTQTRMPALVGTPCDHPAAGVLEDGIVFRQRFDAIPTGANWAGIERYTFSPGERWSQGTQPGAGYGPMLHRLGSGEMTVRAAAPFALTRAGATAPSQMPKETDLTLAPGDAVFLPFGVTSDWRNSGTAPTLLTDTGIAYVSDTSPKDVDPDFNYNAYPIPPQHAPAEFTLRRLTLAPGAVVAVPLGPGLNLLGVEHGLLTLVPASTAGGNATPAPRRVEVPPMNGSSNMVDLFVPRSPTAALHNDGADPVSVLLLATAPLGGTPTFGPAPAPRGRPGLAGTTSRKGTRAWHPRRPVASPRCRSPSDSPLPPTARRGRSRPIRLPHRSPSRCWAKGSRPTPRATGSSSTASRSPPAAPSRPTSTPARTSSTWSRATSASPSSRATPSSPRPDRPRRRNCRRASRRSATRATPSTRTAGWSTPPATPGRRPSCC